MAQQQKLPIGTRVDDDGNPIEGQFGQSSTPPTPTPPAPMQGPPGPGFMEGMGNRFRRIGGMLPDIPNPMQQPPVQDPNFFSLPTRTGPGRVQGEFLGMPMLRGIGNAMVSAGQGIGSAYSQPQPPTQNVQGGEFFPPQGPGGLPEWLFKRMDPMGALGMGPRLRRRIKVEEY